MLSGQPFTSIPTRTLMPQSAHDLLDFFFLALATVSAMARDQGRQECFSYLKLQFSVYSRQLWNEQSSINAAGEFA
jgi:hypothetical protein